jgi:hypothetical protein
MKKMKRLTSFAISMSLLLASFSLLSVVPAEALSLSARGAVNFADSKGDACAGLDQLGGTSCTKPGAANSAGENSIANIAETIVNIISFIAGIAAVILIVVAGVKFITSGGDSNGVASARNTLVYALIGLAVVALAQVIVHFVLQGVLGQGVNADSHKPPPAS